MRHVLPLTFVAVALAVAGCGKPRTPARPAAAAPPATLREADDDFAVRLHRAAKTGGNFVASPAGVSTALSLLRSGANGDTNRELADLLGHTNLGDTPHAAYAERLADWAKWNDKTTTLKMANSLWGGDFRPAFVTAAGRDYSASVKPVGFSKSADAAREVNACVSEATGGLIPGVVTPNDLSAKSRVLLVNAAFFKAKWAAPFDDDTRPETFTLSDGRTAAVPTMGHREPVALARADFAGGVAVALPFGDGRFRMVLVLPKTPAGLPALEETLTANSLAEWAAAAETEAVTLRLPKFAFTTRRFLDDHLKAMGAGRIFGPAADFGAMLDGPAAVERVIHEARIDVSESGATAAAGTVVAVKKSEPNEAAKSRLIRFDHPFLFLITDTKTGAILFLGHVADPRAN